MQSDVGTSHQQWSWPQPWVRYSELVARGDELARVAEAHWDIWTCAVQRVHDGVAALVVGHGGGIEPALVACFPEADHPRWGALFGHCDGAGSGSPTAGSSGRCSLLAWITSHAQAVAPWSCPCS